MFKDNENNFKIANSSFTSRLMLGTGKYKSLFEAQKSIEASKTSLVTVAVRRLQGIKKNSQNNLLNILNWKTISLLPNTAGCTTVEEAVRIAALGREICKKIGQVENSLIKLEVIPDAKYLLPDPIGTLKAAEYLISKKFTVLPYINSDPILAKQLEEIGCATVMPLGSPIGSGCGLQNIENLQIILENAQIPVIIDAGIGTASDATKAMELGATAILVNSAIAQAESPIVMANSMRWAVQAGRSSYISGRMKMSQRARPSSPIIGIPM